MNLRLDNAGKRFLSEWIFRGVNLELKSGERYAILGSNGSGKSTLAQVIGGYLSLTEGKLHTGLSDPDQHPMHVSFTSPYLDVPDEFTIDELAKFHFSLRAPVTGFDPADLTSFLQLERAKNKVIKTFSSGMRQRVKLGLALLTRAEILIVDEPHTNLDAAGKQWFNDNLVRFLQDRTLVVCSNHQPEEYAACAVQLEMKSWK